MTRNDKDGKLFEFTPSGLFVPVAGEYEEPAPRDEVLSVTEEKRLYIPKSMDVKFQKDFNRTVKPHPLFGERVRQRETTNRTTFRFSRTSDDGEDS